VLGFALVGRTMFLAASTTCLCLVELLPLPPTDDGARFTAEPPPSDKGSTLPTL